MSPLTWSANGQNPIAREAADSRASTVDGGQTDLIAVFPRVIMTTPAEVVNNLAPDSPSFVLCRHQCLLMLKHQEIIVELEMPFNRAFTTETGLQSREKRRWRNTGKICSQPGQSSGAARMRLARQIRLSSLTVSCMMQGPPLATKCLRSVIQIRL